MLLMIVKKIKNKLYIEKILNQRVKSYL